MKLLHVIRDFAAIPFFATGCLFIWIGGLIVTPGTCRAWERAIENHWCEE